MTQPQYGLRTWQRRHSKSVLGSFNILTVFTRTLEWYVIHKWLLVQWQTSEPPLYLSRLSCLLSCALRVFAEFSGSPSFRKIYLMSSFWEPKEKPSKTTHTWCWFSESKTTKVRGEWTTTTPPWFSSSSLEIYLITDKKMLILWSF